MKGLAAALCAKTEGVYISVISGDGVKRQWRNVITLAGLAN
jgi:hypothetical protein